MTDGDSIVRAGFGLGRGCLLFPSTGANLERDREAPLVYDYNNASGQIAIYWARTSCERDWPARAAARSWSWIHPVNDREVACRCARARVLDDVSCMRGP